MFTPPSLKHHAFYGLNFAYINTRTMHDITTRAQALTMKAYGHTSNLIEHATGIKPRNLRYLWPKAINRGFNPEAPKILDIYVQDAPRSGRPTVQKPRKTSKLINRVCKNRQTRGMNTEQLAAAIGGSPMTVWRLLRKQLNIRKTKPMRKPGLTKHMKAERLQ
jgi:hypothetical protein